MDNFIQQSQLIEEIISKEKFSDIKKNYNEISKKYRNENIQSKSVVSSDMQALSYLSSRMGETSVIINSVFEKFNSFISIDDNINSVLDFGSGTGSVLWALKNFVSTIDITAVEKQESMIKYSKLMSKHLEYNMGSKKHEVNK
jgi:ribosomal protein RSM22 (predicted rRNA methylase)